MKNDILVVDDEETIREVVRRYLEREGFSVREAEDGYAAIDAVKDQEPDQKTDHEYGNLGPEGLLGLHELTESDNGHRPALGAQWMDQKTFEK